MGDIAGGMGLAERISEAGITTGGVAQSMY